MYSAVAEAYEALEKTTKRLELTDILTNLFKQTPKELIDKVVYLTQGKLYADFVGVEIGIAEKLATRVISSVSGVSEDKVERIYREVGDLGGAALEVLKEKTQVTLFSEPLTVERVYSTLEKTAKTAGAGSIEAKLGHLSHLLTDASPLEAKYIIRTVTGKLRLGIADYTVLDALAIAYTGDKANRAELERAYNLSSDLGLVAREVATGGLKRIKSFKVKVGNPIRPMLAERMESAKEILEKLGGKVVAEYKLDGERLQLHISPDSVSIFSRRLENITSHYPDITKLVRSGIKGKRAIIEGEAVAIDIDTGDYLPFQELMHRRRKYGIEEAVEQYPVSLNLFDILYLDGSDLTAFPYTGRRKKLEGILNGSDRLRIVPAITSSDSDEIEKYMEEAITNGCEGLVIKDMNSPYRAGAREFLWVKLKREYRSELTDTVDLVVVGGFYGRGRRAGRYGALLLASYDKGADMFRTVCKVGTGFTDEDLMKLYEMLQDSKIKHRHSRVDSKMEADVWFVPNLVLEIIGSETTLSPIHTAKMDA
ncbi:MAG: ATP-dependent DNA ligase, partial [Thaumarchaeota archaeon]|nr:ATP-dependent DNA ligase [Nitrososphaerota archaeon]